MTDYNIRFANKDDISKIKRLWTETFKDSPEFIDEFLKYFNNEIDIVVSQNNGEIYSMACFIDVTAENKKGKYLYAVATSPKKRKQKMASSSIEFAKKYFKENGYSFILTIPANQKLIPFYEMLGFNKKTYKRSYIEEGISFKIFPEPLSCDKLFQIRQNNADILNFNRSFFEFVYKDLISDGWHIFGYEDSYVICKIQNNILLVREGRGKFSPLCFANALGFNKAQINCYDGDNVFSQYLTFDGSALNCSVELMLEK